MLTEVTHLQEIMDSLCMQASDPACLPALSEQVILDIKGGDSWSFQMPDQVDCFFFNFINTIQI